MTMRKKMTRLLLIAGSWSVLSSCIAQDQAMNLGIPVSESDLQALDLVAPPDGTGFPEGSGTAQQGRAVFNTQCAACHAADGTGTSGATVIVGGDMQSDEAPLRTVGSYWPHASTLFDYIRRAMPANAPKSLNDEEVYQVVAYVLYLNGIVDQDAVIDKAALMAIEMPNADGFIDVSQRQ